MGLIFKFPKKGKLRLDKCQERHPPLRQIKRSVTASTAVIQPLEYEDDETGDRITVSVSPYYSKITVNNRECYFVRETGEFDGVATIEIDGPILIYDADSGSKSSERDAE
ncbi:MAG: hypothetical protein ACLQDV_01475 [Candidatus Binataceae bacterium]